MELISINLRIYQEYLVGYNVRYWQQEVYFFFFAQVQRFELLKLRGGEVLVVPVELDFYTCNLSCATGVEEL